jgi:hypothetical protein
VYIGYLLVRRRLACNTPSRAYLGSSFISWQGLRRPVQREKPSPHTLASQEEERANWEDISANSWGLKRSSGSGLRSMHNKKAQEILRFFLSI